MRQARYHDEFQINVCTYQHKILSRWPAVTDRSFHAGASHHLPRMHAMWQSRLVHTSELVSTSWQCVKPLCNRIGSCDSVSERLRRWTRNPLGSARRGSNPLAVVLYSHMGWCVGNCKLILCCCFVGWLCQVSKNAHTECICRRSSHSHSDGNHTCNHFCQGNLAESS